MGCHLSDPYSIAPPLSLALVGYYGYHWRTHSLLSFSFPPFIFTIPVCVSMPNCIFLVHGRAEYCFTFFFLFCTLLRSIIRNILIYHDDDARSDGDVQRHTRPGVWRHAGPHLPSIEHRSARLPDGTPSSARCGGSESCRTMVSFGSTGTATLLSVTIFTDYGSSTQPSPLCNKMPVVINYLELVQTLGR